MIRLKKIKNIDYNAGFTLIEVLVVIAIIGIISLLGWEQLMRTKSESNVLNVCTEAASAINLTRSYAVTGKCSGSGANSLTITFSGNVATITNSNEFVCETINLSSGTSCSGTVSYSIPDGGKSGDSSIPCSFSSITRNVLIDSRKATCQ